MRKVCGSRAKAGPGDQLEEGDSDVPLVIIKQELAKEQYCHIALKIGSRGRLTTLAPDFNHGRESKFENVATLTQDPDEDGHPEELGQREEEEELHHSTGVLRVQELLSHLSIGQTAVV